MAEIPVVMTCQGSELLSILHRPECPSRVGAVFVVGGAQYRVGSHRMFVQMARYLSDQGVTCLRFDRRGMGDSQGPDLGFENSQEDIGVAFETLRKQAPELKEIYLLGLCDGATAGVFYGHSEPDISGYILINPWIRSSNTQSQALIGHYYKKRILDAEFWRQLFAGKVNFGKSLSEYLGHWRNTRDSRQNETSDSPLADLLYSRLSQDLKRTLILVSENDITGQEFCAVRNESRWQSLLDKEIFELLFCEDADHTFSEVVSQDYLFQQCANWLVAD